MFFAGSWGSFGTAGGVRCLSGEEEEEEKQVGKFSYLVVYVWDFSKHSGND